MLRPLFLRELICCRNLVSSKYGVQSIFGQGHTLLMMHLLEMIEGFLVLFVSVGVALTRLIVETKVSGLQDGFPLLLAFNE